MSEEKFKEYVSPPVTKEEVWCSAPIVAGVASAFYEFFRKDGIEGVGLGRIALDVSDIDEVFFNAVIVHSDDDDEFSGRCVALVVTPTLSERIWPAVDEGDGEDTKDGHDAIDWMTKRLLAKVQGIDEEEYHLAEILGDLQDLENILRSVGEKADNVSDSADEVVKTGKDIADLLH